MRISETRSNVSWPHHWRRWSQTRPWKNLVHSKFSASTKSEKYQAISGTRRILSTFCAQLLKNSQLSVKIGNALCKEPILQYPNFSQPFILTTDASKFAVGGVLSQGPIGKDLPIAYASRVLNPAETNVVPPEEQRPAIIHEAHASAVGGHKGVTKTFHRIRERYYWSNLLGTQHPRAVSNGLTGIRLWRIQPQHHIDLTPRHRRVPTTAWK